MSNSLCVITFLFDNCKFNISNTDVSNITTESFLILNDSTLHVSNFSVQNTTTENVFFKFLSTEGTFQNLTVYHSQIFNLFEITESPIVIFSIDFASTNTLTTFLFKILSSTVNLHDINVNKSSVHNFSLFKIVNSNITVSQLTVNHLTSSLLSSNSSFIVFTDLIVSNSIADCLVLMDSSKASFSNIWISNISSDSDNFQILATASSIIIDHLDLDYFKSSNFLLLSDSSCLLSNSKFNQINSSASFVRLVSSTIHLENVTILNADVIYLIKLNLSYLFCHNVALSKSLFGHIVVSQDSNISLSEIITQTSDILESFSVLNNSFMNASSLSFVQSKLASICVGYESVIILDFLQSLNASMVIPPESSLFYFSRATLSLSNFYANVVNLPLINATDSIISCTQIQISSISCNILFYLDSSSFSLLDSAFYNLSKRFIYSFTSDSILQDIAVISSLNDTFNQSGDEILNFNDHLIDIQFSNFTSTGLFVCKVKCDCLLHSSNSRIILDDIRLSDLVLNSAISCTNTDLQSNNLIFENLSLNSTFIIMRDSTSSLNYSSVHNIESLKLFEILRSSLNISHFTVTNFDFIFLLQSINSNVVFEFVSIDECKSDLVSEIENDSYFTVIESTIVLNNFEFVGCISQSFFKSGLYLTNSSFILRNSSQVLFLSTLIVECSSLSFFSGYPIISKFVLIDQQTEFLGTDSLLDLSELSSNISISPSKHCCNTSFCQVSLQLDDIVVLENLMSISVKQSQSFQYFYHLDSLSLVLEHSKSFNYSAPSILFNFVIDQMAFSYLLFIPICPIEFVSLEPPTRSGLVPLLLLILG
ncbi:hypothetical protein GEMRC1_008391 [Eukaryota sp. GEM-RC1]